MKSLLRVLTKKEVLSPPPVWFMRQAGRYLPEYLRLRAEKGSFLDLVYDPQFACEVTLQPIRRYEMSGAILFSDILVVPDALGQGLEFRAGEGPVLDAVKTPADFEKLSLNRLDDKFENIFRTVTAVREQLDEEGFDDTTLIGFAGSPWTVACYMVQGHGKCAFLQVIEFMRNDPQGFSVLVEIIVEATLIYLKGQIEAGAEALQLFDSWAGLLRDDEFEKWVLKPTQTIIAELKAEYPQIPITGFARTSNEADLLRYAQIKGLDCLGLGQDVDLSLLAGLPNQLAVQGNLDPESLLRGGEALNIGIRNILAACKDRPHIFNLGHGVIKETPPENITQALDVVRGKR